MDVTLLQFLIVCPLVFVAGAVDAVAGGGGLITVPAYLIAGLPVHYAIGTNKLSSSMGTAMATWRFAKNGYIQWRLALLCVACALLGANLGAHLALLVPDRAFTVSMLVVLPLVAVYVLRGRAFAGDKPPLSPGQTAARGMAAALVVGAYDGAYGPGTGTFLLLLLTGLAHLSLQRANGVTKAINLASNVSALAVFLLNGKVVLLLGLVAGGFSLLGNYVGTRFFDRYGAASVRPLMLAVLAVFFGKVLLDLL